MKTLFTTAWVMVLTLTAFAAETRPLEAKKTRMTNKEFAERVLRKTGGNVRQPNSGRGEIVFVNTQKTVEGEILKKVVGKLDRDFKFILSISDKDIDGSRGRFVIRLEDLNRKARVLLAPEDRWVSVNVKSLAADDPPKAILNDRFEKEVRRAFAFVCGGTCGTEPGGLCRLVSNLEDLDAIPGLDYSLDMEARIFNNLRAAGVEPYRIAKYIDAVKEGWAPAPTNEAQKTIWNKVHTLPSNPIKIKYDPKRDK